MSPDKEFNDLSDWSRIINKGSRRRVVIKNAVLVTGDRNWKDYALVGRKMGAYPPGTLFLHGNAVGADQCCDEQCSSMGYPRMRMPYFAHLGRAGGPVRNRYMLEILLALQAAGTEVEVLGFHDNIRESKGTRDMLTRAKKAGVKAKLVRHRA